MATHSSVLAWRIPRMEGPGGLSLWGYKELDMTKQLTHTHTYEYLLHTFSPCTLGAYGLQAVRLPPGPP